MTAELTVINGPTTRHCPTVIYAATREDCGVTTIVATRMLASLPMCRIDIATNITAIISHLYQS